MRFDNGWHRVADPARHLTDGLASLTNPVGSVADKLLVGLFRIKCLFRSLATILSGPETTTLQRLRVRGAGRQALWLPVVLGRFAACWCLV